jgi:hypothetical protein
MAGKSWPELTLERVKEALRYDPDMGTFTWLEDRPGKHGRIGERAGHLLVKTGYRTLMFERCKMAEHRLAFFYMTGEWPTIDVDHINRDRSDNRWDNLRLGTRSQNRANAASNRNNKCGLKGVHLARGVWKSQICVRGKVTNLGAFDCPAAAHFAYVLAAKEHFGEFARAG